MSNASQRSIHESTHTFGLAIAFAFVLSLFAGQGLAQVCRPGPDSVPFSIAASGNSNVTALISGNTFTISQYITFKTPVVQGSPTSTWYLDAADCYLRVAAPPNVTNGSGPIRFQSIHLDVEGQTLALASTDVDLSPPSMAPAEPAPPPVGWMTTPDLGGYYDSASKPISSSMTAAPGPHTMTITATGTFDPGFAAQSNFLVEAVGCMRLTPPAVPQANFAVSAQTPAFGPPGLNVDFIPQLGGGAPSSWLWNFGDGASTIAIGPVSHVYAVNGRYDVTLKVGNASGLGTQTKKKLVVVGMPMRLVSRVASTVNPTGTYDTADKTFGPGDTLTWGIDVDLSSVPANADLIVVANFDWAALGIMEARPVYNTPGLPDVLIGSPFSTPQAMHPISFSTFGLPPYPNIALGFGPHTVSDFIAAAPVSLFQNVAPLATGDKIRIQAFVVGRDLPASNDILFTMQ